MRLNIGKLFSNEATRRWAKYFVKAVALFAAFFVCAQLTTFMPPICVAIIWAVLSIAASIRPMYHFVIKKVYRQHGLKSGGILTRINGGRTLSLVGAFIVSALCIAGLLLEAPKWELTEWLVAVAAILLYPIAFLIAGKVIKTSVEIPYQLSMTISTSCISVGVFLCIIFLFISIQGSSASYDTYAQALLSVKQPFRSSPTALLQIAGDYNQIAESLTAYGLSKLSVQSALLAVFLRLCICIAAFFGVARLVGSCILESNEIKLAFLPLDAVKQPEANYAPAKSYIIVSCILPIVLIGGFLFAESWAEKFVDTKEYKNEKAFILNLTESIAYNLVDGNCIDSIDFAELVLSAQDQVTALASKRDAELVPLINAIYEKRIDSVDSYLDWFYSPEADLIRLTQAISGNVEASMQDKFNTMVYSAVDDSEFRNRCGYYIDEYKLIISRFHEQIARMSIPDDIAREYAKTQAQPINFDELAQSLDPNRRFLEEGESISEGVGVGFKTGKFVGVFDAFIFLPIDAAINREKYRDDIVTKLKEEQEALISSVKASDDGIRGVFGRLNSLASPNEPSQ